MNLCVTMTLLFRFGGLEPGAAERFRSVYLAAPPHVPDHIFAHALHVLVSCKEKTIIESRKSISESQGYFFRYLVSSTELRMLVFDTDLSAAA